MELVIFSSRDQVRQEELIHCKNCKCQIAFVEDHLEIVQNGRTGIFRSVFNVKLLADENYPRQVNGNTVADVYCTQCEALLGMILITVPRPSGEIRERRFLLKLCKLVYWNDCPMIFIQPDDGQGEDVDIDQLLNELNGGANVEQVANEHAEAMDIDQFLNEQEGGANVEQGANEQEGGANVEQVANEQEGGANVGQVANEQEGGANVEQVANEQEGGANVGQVANEQEGGANVEQVANEQEGGANVEQVANQNVDQLADKMGINLKF